MKDSISVRCAVNLDGEVEVPAGEVGKSKHRMERRRFGKEKG